MASGSDVLRLRATLKWKSERRSARIVTIGTEGSTCACVSTLVLRGTGPAPDNWATIVFDRSGVLLQECGRRPLFRAEVKTCTAWLLSCERLRS